MGEIHNPHDPEDEGQPDTEKGVRPSRNQGVHKMLQELFQEAGSFTADESCTWKPIAFLVTPVRVISAWVRFLRAALPSRF
ncbi:MAG: hypothetical protein AAEI08_04260 [Gammaproteobacteria bacterium]